MSLIDLDGEGLFYEDARQEALTEMLGQVHCSTSETHESPCPDCKAVL